MKYIDADKFIKKYEKMIDDIPASVDSGAGYVIDEVYKIFDSLQQEQPQVADASKMEPEVENYIQYYLEAIGFGYGGWVDGLRDEDLKKIARHFYKLGLNARKEK